MKTETNDRKDMCGQFKSMKSQHQKDVEQKQQYNIYSIAWKENKTRTLPGKKWCLLTSLHAHYIYVLDPSKRPTEMVRVMLELID